MRMRWGITLLLFGLTFAVFFQVREHEFVKYDDPLYILGNPRVVSGFNIESVVDAFRMPYRGAWFPLTWISHQIDYELYGIEPAGYLLTNVLMHACSAVLLFFALWRMSGAAWLSAFVAAVFAVHPLHVESVAWAAERKDTLSGVFWMLTMYAYARYVEGESWLRYGAVFLLLTLGLLAKPLLLSLPCVLLLLDYWPLRRLQGPDSRRLDAGRVVRAIGEKIPLMVPAAAVSAVTLAFREEMNLMALNASLSLELRMINAVESYAAYLAQSFWPRGLAVVYPHPLGHVNLSSLGIAVLVLLAITLYALQSARRRPYLVVGWCWFLATIVPVSGLVQAGFQARADRYMYIPLVGLSIAVAWGVADLARGWRHGRIALGAGGVALVIALTVCSWWQVRYWRDTDSLLERAVEVVERNYVAHAYLGVVRAEEGRWEEATRHYWESIRIEPLQVMPYLGLGRLLLARGEFDEALSLFESALRVAPDNPEARAGLGLALFRADRLGEARIHLERALAAGVEIAEVRFALGAIAARRGDFELAVRQQRQALVLAPEMREALAELAWILATCEDEVIRAPEEAVRLVGRFEATDDVRLLDALAAAHAAAGRFEYGAQIARRAEDLAAERGDDALRDAIHARVGLYEKRRPYIERASGAAR